MRLLFLPVAAVAALGLSGIAAAQSGGALPGLTIAGMNGKCTRLVTEGQDRTAACDPILMNNIYSNGRSSFLFVTRDRQAIVSFFGNDGPAQGDVGTLQVIQVYMTGFDGQPVPRPTGATGSCSYTNPYKGPSRIDCRAVVGNKRFEASFVSDGQPPNVFGDGARR